MVTSEKLEENLLEQFISGVNLACKSVESGNVTLAGATEVASTVQLLEGEKVA